MGQGDSDGYLNSIVLLPHQHITVSPQTQAWLQDACVLGKQYAFESSAYVPNIPGGQYDPYFVAISIQGDLDETFSWNKLTSEVGPFDSTVQSNDFVFVPGTYPMYIDTSSSKHSLTLLCPFSFPFKMSGDAECLRSATTPEDKPNSALSLCPSDWKNYGAVTYGSSQWNEMMKFDCNRWDWNTTTVLYDVSIA